VRKPQGKLVRVVSGAVFDVAVDLRASSINFARWVGVELSAQNHRQLWIPAGFGHAFLALTDGADFLYKTTCDLPEGSSGLGFVGG
jgi:dTDP-4-dehydrorhamnose 3,5-epimerase